MPRQIVKSVPKPQRKIYVSPKIVKEFKSKKELWYKLDNGNIISAENYAKHYGEPKKQPVLPKTTKDSDNPLKAEIHNRGMVSYKQSKV